MQIKGKHWTAWTLAEIKEKVMELDRKWDSLVLYDRQWLWEMEKFVKENPNHMSDSEMLEKEKKKVLRCVMCRQENPKTWTEFDRNRIMAHVFDDHHGNLSFLSDDEIREMVEEIEE